MFSVDLIEYLHKGETIVAIGNTTFKGGAKWLPMAVSGQPKTFVKILSLPDPKHTRKLLSSFRRLIERSI